jgi:two-component system response regulator DesR
MLESRNAGGRPTTVGRVIRVVVTEPKALHSAALTCLLSTEPDMDVVGSPLTDDELVAAVACTDADIVLLDLDAPGREVVGLCTLLGRIAPECRVIALSAGRPAPDLLRLLADAAHGLVSKHAGPSALLDAVRRVAAGERVHVAGPIPVGARSAHTPTERELELLRHAAHGSSVRELAQRLCLSEGTVRNYLSRTMTKLGARNRIDAIGIAQRAGWL